MSLIHEIANAVRTRRREMGVSQAVLATASGLPLSTICSAEDLTAPNLSVSEAEALLESIGLSLQVVTNGSRTTSTRRFAQPARPALEVAAATASLSYTGHFSGEQLQQVLLDREAPNEDIRPHLAALLDEAPMSLLARVVDEMNTSNGLGRAAAWARMGELAQHLKCGRAIWRLRQGRYCEALSSRWQSCTRPKTYGTARLSGRYDMHPLPCTARTKAQSWAAPLEWHALPDRRTDEEQRFEVRVPERRAQPVKHLSQARKRVVQRERATFTRQSSHELNQFVSSHLRLQNGAIPHRTGAVSPQAGGSGPHQLRPWHKPCRPAQR